MHQFLYFVYLTRLRESLIFFPLNLIYEITYEYHGIIVREFLLWNKISLEII